MKTPPVHLYLAAALAAGFAVAAFAQDSAAPVTEPPPGSTPIPLVPGTDNAVATPSPSPSPSVPPSADTAKPGIDEPIPLIPQQGFGPQPKEAPIPEGAEAPTGKPQGTPPAKGSAEQLRRDIRIRELKTQVEQDPEVVAALEVAKHTKTAEGHRTAMRNYYTLIATKVEKLDPSVRGPIEGWLYGHLFSYEQHRVRPSKLIENIRPLPGSSSKDHAPAVPGQAKGKANAAPTPTPEEEQPEATPLPTPQGVRHYDSTSAPGEEDYSGGR